MSIRRRGRDDDDCGDGGDAEAGTAAMRGYASDSDLPSSRGRRTLFRGRRAAVRDEEGGVGVGDGVGDGDDDGWDWTDCRGLMKRLAGFCCLVLVMEVCVLNFIVFRIDTQSRADPTGQPLRDVQLRDAAVLPPPASVPPPVSVDPVQVQPPPPPVAQPPLPYVQPAEPVLPVEPPTDAPQPVPDVPPHVSVMDDDGQALPPLFNPPEDQGAPDTPTPATASNHLSFFPRLSNKNEFMAERHRTSALDATGAFTESRLETAVGGVRVTRLEHSKEISGVENDLRQALSTASQPVTQDAVLYAHLVRCFDLKPDTIPVWFPFQVARSTHTIDGWRRACLLFWATKRHASGSLRALRDAALKHAVDGGVLPSVLLYNGGFLHYGMKGEDGLAGDPLQWTDLFSALIALGVPITVVTHKDADPDMTLTRLQTFDLIFTDYLGADSLPALQHPSLACRLRVLDAYGTTARFNTGADGHAPFCCLNLELRQFLTFLPGRSPDNTFLGFAVDHLPPHSFVKNPSFTRQAVVKPVLRSQRDTRREKLKFKLAKVMVETVEGVKQPRAQRQWYGLVWGKLGKYYDKPGVKQYLHHLAEHIPLLATVGPDKQSVPPFVANFGILKQSSYANLVRSVVVVVGIGEPLIGNGAIEALAGGAVVLNLRFDPPVPSTGKPTSQLLTSQHPELEGVPKPYAWTLSLNATRAEISAVMIEVAQLFRDTQPFGHRYDVPGHSMPDFLTSVLSTVSTDVCGRGF